MPDRPQPLGLPESLRGVDRCLVMGVLNVTPDSFSDGGLFLDEAAAVKHGLALRDAGADLIDVGGESTRPGARRIPVAEELDRVLAVVRALAAAGVPVSIDTMRAEVASAALDAGAIMVNDVSGGLADPEMLGFAATTGRPYIVMHWRGPSTVMDELAGYDDVVTDVRQELSARLKAAQRAGLDSEQIVLDPGLGFAKNAEHNWSLLAHLDDLATLGRPLLVGASRKRFLGGLLSSERGVEPPPAERDSATAAVSALAALAGAWCVRVHEPAASKDAVLVSEAWRRAGVRTDPNSSST